MMMKVEILSRKLVAPSSPTQPHLRSYNISAMDQAERHSVYPTFISYYYNNFDLEHLEKSLSRVLTIYYPLAGRFSDQECNTVTCNDQGVDFVQAKVPNMQLARFQLLCGRSGDHLDANQLNLLVPDPLQPCPDPAALPLLLVQMSMFECGGVAIGVRFSHRVADGLSMALFINGWASACRSGLHQLPPISLDLPSLFPLRLNDDERRIKPVAFFKRQPGLIFVTTRLVFSEAAIQSLRERTGSSRVVVVTAFIWRSLIRVARAKHGLVRPSSLWIAVNMRRRTTLAIPDHSFGNFFTYAFARFVPVEDSGPPELRVLVGLLEDAVEKKVAQCTKQQNAEEMLLMVHDSNRELGEEVRRDDADVHGLASWCRFPFQEADFGWGKPMWVSSTYMPVPITRLIDSADGSDGIEAWISLEQHEMLLFQQEPDILGLAIHQA